MSASTLATVMSCDTVCFSSVTVIQAADKHVLAYFWFVKCLLKFKQNPGKHMKIQFILHLARHRYMCYNSLSKKISSVKMEQIQTLNSAVQLQEANK